MMRKKAAYMLILFIAVFLDAALYAGTKGRTEPLGKIKNRNEAFEPRVLGLFIGIENYRGQTWQNTLKFPQKDVRDMVSFFSDNVAMTLDYKIVLTEPEKTTRDYIFNRAFEDFKIRNAYRDDVVIFYLSGHGTLSKEVSTIVRDGKAVQVSKNVPYIVTTDTVEGKVSDSALALDKVIAWFETLESKRKVLILDMCNSGIGKSLLSPDQEHLIKSSKGQKIEPLKDSWASIILSACPMGETSFEDEKLQNGVYTHFLLEGMRYGDLNGDGAITISEAHNYAIDKTIRYTWENKKYKQVPTAYSKILGKDPIIVNGKAKKEGKPVLFSFASSNHGAEVFVDGRCEGMLPKGIIVEPGKRKIELKRDGRTLYQKKIDIEPDNHYMLPMLEVPEESTASSLHSFFLVEGGYRSFIRGDVPEVLLPSGPVGGVSAYLNGRRFALSCGFDFTRNSDLEQYVGHIGPRVIFNIWHSTLFIGPDLTATHFRYASDTIRHNTVTQEQTFLSPGAEVLWSIMSSGHMVIAVGVRGHYLAYEDNEVKNNTFSNQVFMSTGILF